jgi:hypothetical protein
VGPYQPTGNEVYHGGNETGYQDAANHVRTPSLAPLLAGLGAAAAGSAAGATAQASSSRPSSSGRPSTGGSTYPLLPQGQQQQSQGFPPQGYGGQPGLNAYPPSSNQSYGGSQGYYGSDHGHHYGGGSASGHSTNPSTGSWNSGPVVQPQTNIIPVMAGGNRQSYIDPEQRTGSPVSIQEHRVLQVINPDNSYTFSSGGGASSAVAGGSSSSAAAAAFAAGSPSPPPGTVDGKGRPIRLGGEKAPLVHLDGGLYEEPLVQIGGPSSSSNDPAPPAYSS